MCIELREMVNVGWSSAVLSEPQTSACVQLMSICEVKFILTEEFMNQLNLASQCLILTYKDNISWVWRPPDNS